MPERRGAGSGFGAGWTLCVGLGAGVLDLQPLSAAPLARVSDSAASASCLIIFAPSALSCTLTLPQFHWRVKLIYWRLAEIMSARRSVTLSAVLADFPIADAGALAGLVSVLIGLIWMLAKGILISGRSVDRLEDRYRAEITMLREISGTERARADRATDLLERALRSADLTDRVMVVLGEKATEQREQRAQLVAGDPKGATP